MAKTFVNAGRRRQFTPTLAHRVGDLVYKDGFFGVAQDDVAFSSSPTAVDRPFVHILDGVWDVPANRFDASLWNAGLKVYAQPTNGATSVLLYANAASLPASPAAVPVGRLWATAPAGASQVRLSLFGPENQW
jgi:predicted RecA/RadA family phage recombinase